MHIASVYKIYSYMNMIMYTFLNFLLEITTSHANLIYPLIQTKKASILKLITI